MGCRGGWVVALVLSAGCGSYEADVKALCKRADENARSLKRPRHCVSVSELEPNLPMH